MKNRESTYRTDRVASLVQLALVEVLKKGKILDERLINCPLTITKIVVTADLKTANCYFLPFNTSLKSTELIEALYNSRYAIRNYVTKKINLKYSPELKFHYDHGFDNALEVEKLLKQVGSTSNEI